MEAAAAHKVRRGALAALRFLLHTFSMANPIPESAISVFTTV
jgi:hypothetical protein